MPLPDEILQKCPDCGRNLCHTNALDLCGLYMVWCVFYGCRWCEIYSLG